MPLQWSAAHEDLTGLIGTVTLNALYCTSLQIIERINLLVETEFMNREYDTSYLARDNYDSCTPTKTGNSRTKIKACELFGLSISPDWTDSVRHVKMYKNILVALLMDKEWAATDNAKLISIFVGALTKISSIFDKISMKELSAGPLSNTSMSHSNELDVLRNLRDELRVTLEIHKNDLQYTTYGGTEDIWIIKPVGLSCGEKIVCARNLLGVLTAARDLLYKCVVQKYIERPLLVRKTRKFDIRQWVLVTSIDPLIIYGFSECYLRLSAESFSLTDESLLCPTVHLCNHAIQKNRIEIEDVHRRREVLNEGADASKTASAFYYDTMMSQSQFEEELQLKSDVGSGTVFEEKILPHIKRITVKTLQSVRDKVHRDGSGFEWLGLDLMVVESNPDENVSVSDSSSMRDYEVLLLEVNVSPDISLSTPITERLVGPAVEDLFELLLEEGAADNPVAAATSRIAPRNMGVLTEDNMRTDVPPSSEPTALRWNLWFLGPPCGKREHLAFGRAKSDVAFLGNRVDYLPRKVQCADRIIEILKYSMNTSVGDPLPLLRATDEEIKCEDEEDEI